MKHLIHLHRNAQDLEEFWVLKDCRSGALVSHSNDLECGFTAPQEGAMLTLYYANHSTKVLCGEVAEMDGDVIVSVHKLPAYHPLVRGA